MPATPQPSNPLERQALPATEEASFTLSRDDVERLLTEETPDVRIDVLRKVAGRHASKNYSLRELAAAEQILRLLVRDTEVSVREALASALKDNPHVPRDIILSLTRDVDAVALPVIESSNVLTDNDLISLIQSAKHAGKPAAVARRKRLSQPVANALVETHNPQIITQLMKNPDAVLPEDILQTVLREYARNTDVMHLLAQRPNLPVTVVEKIITLVSASLAESLRVQYNIAPNTIAAETEKTREVATLRLVDGPITPRDVEKLVDQLQAFGRLTPSMILTSLCRGNLYFFETSLAKLSHIPVRNAQLLIHDKGGLGFKALYGKAALPEKFFSACKLLLEAVSQMQRGQDAGSGYSDALAQNLLTRAAGKDIENLSYIIALIRQHA